MAQLIMALFVEGATDARFLDVIAERTALQILTSRSHTVVEVLPIQRLHPSGGEQAQRILAAARDASGYHLLLVHADADAHSPEATWTERIMPGFVLVQEAAKRNEDVCDRCVAIIPVQMTEAWFLADSDSLLQIIGTQESAENLGLRHTGRNIESIADPKVYVNNILTNARRTMPRSRRKYVQLGSLYEPLARRISLERLKLLPSFLRFHADLAQSLAKLGLISHMHL